MNEHNIIYLNIPTTIPGYAIQTPDGYTTIILNARCGYNQNVESYLHELKHINCNDFDSDLPVDILEILAHAV